MSVLNVGPSIATAEEEAVRAQIDRILRSDVMRSSDGLRRLLQFLVDKTLSGEADQLKEYSIAVDAFGKPSTYDPQHDSHVRIQVGRLRHKLTDYYNTEGKHDPMVVDLPKRRFKLIWQARPEIVPVETPPLTSAATVAVADARPQTYYLIGMLTLALLIVVSWASWVTLELSKERRESSLFRASWSPELEALWAPFLSTDRPLLVSIEAPLFVTFPGIGYFRDRWVNRPEDIAKTPSFAAIQKVLKADRGVPTNYYTPIGEVNVIMTLGKLLATRKANVSIVKSNELTWQQLSDNNVLFIGSEQYLNPQLLSMPIKQELVVETHGIHNLRPLTGEPQMFVDNFAGGKGEVYALISHTPGPLGNGDVESFGSSISAGRMAALQSLTDQASARMLFGKMALSSGKVPRYYQLVLRVRFDGNVPIETRYVLHRELRAVEVR